jgi:hypothetical protein
MLFVSHCRNNGGVFARTRSTGEATIKERVTTDPDWSFGTKRMQELAPALLGAETFVKKHQARRCSRCGRGWQLDGGSPTSKSIQPERDIA